MQTKLTCTILVDDKDDEIITWDYKEIRKYFMEKLMSNEINHFHVSTKHKGNILYEDIPDKYQAITSDNADYFEQKNEHDS